jgi:hypothetical protein
VTRALNDPRLWACVLAAVCFLAGLSAGVFVGRSRVAEPPSGGAPFDLYRAAFVRQFELDPRRERLFHELLRNYEQEVEDARTSLLRRNQPELEQALARIGQRYQSYVRDHVLPPEQRAEFDALSEQWVTIQ